MSAMPAASFRIHPEITSGIAGVHFVGVTEKSVESIVPANSNESWKQNLEIKKVKIEMRVANSRLMLAIAALITAVASPFTVCHFLDRSKAKQERSDDVSSYTESVSVPVVDQERYTRPVSTIEYTSDGKTVGYVKFLPDTEN